MKPFLLLGTRDEDAAADNEYDAFLGFTGLPSRCCTGSGSSSGRWGRSTSTSGPGSCSAAGRSTPATESSKSPVQRRVEADLRALLDEVVTADFPFLGACYGIGVLGTHHGGTVDGAHAEPVGRVPVTLTPEGRPDALLAGAARAVRGVRRAQGGGQPTCRADAVRLATSPGCPVQAFRVGRHVYATQFHPELDIHGLCTRIEVYKHDGYFPLRRRTRSKRGPTAAPCPSARPRAPVRRRYARREVAAPRPGRTHCGFPRRWLSATLLAELARLPGFLLVLTW